MSTETLTHDAHIQTIDEYKREFRTDTGRRVRLPRQLDLQRRRVQDRPPDRPEHGAGQRRNATIARSPRPLPGGWTTSDGRGRRLKKKIEAPDSALLEPSEHDDAAVRSADRQHGSQPGEHRLHEGLALWLIDHTRAFRKNTDVEDAGSHHALRPAGVRAAEDARSRHAEARSRQVAGRRANQVAPRPPRPDRQEAGSPRAITPCSTDSRTSAAFNSRKQTARRIFRLAFSMPAPMASVTPIRLPFSRPPRPPASR